MPEGIDIHIQTDSLSGERHIQTIYHIEVEHATAHLLLFPIESYETFLYLLFPPAVRMHLIHIT